MTKDGKPGLSWRVLILPYLGKRMRSINVSVWTSRGTARTTSRCLPKSRVCSFHPMPAILPARRTTWVSVAPPDYWVPQLESSWRRSLMERRSRLLWWKQTTNPQPNGPSRMCSFRMRAIRPMDSLASVRKDFSLWWPMAPYGSSPTQPIPRPSKRCSPTTAASR